VYKRGGYLQALLTPGGLTVTDDFPANHLHHHGVWTPWTKTQFEGRAPDFWNMGAKKGTVEFVALDRVWSGPDAGGLVARHRFVDLLAPEPRTVLHETWTVTARAVAGLRTLFLIDLEVEQTCATPSPLVLPTYHYGGLGFRGSWLWNGEDKGRFLTSEGLTDRLKINETRARWFWMGGPLEGGEGGVAILGHPGNVRAPQPMRLHPKEPFFSFAPQQMGEMRLVPGETYRAKFRFVTADGELSAAEIEALWKAYAEGEEVRS
jgi:hypothetical protein